VFVEDIRGSWGRGEGGQCRVNIHIYSDIQIFISKYWIFEYEYYKFDFLNIFIFDQTLSLVKGEYLNILGYSDTCL
jgi:hypothetical protein